MARFAFSAKPLKPRRPEIPCSHFGWATLLPSIYLNAICLFWAFCLQKEQKTVVRIATKIQSKLTLGKINKRPLIYEDVAYYTYGEEATNY